MAHTPVFEEPVDGQTYVWSATLKAMIPTSVDSRSADLTFTTVAGSVVLTADDDTRWRLLVSDAGVLSTEEVV